MEQYQNVGKKVMMEQRDERRKRQTGIKDRAGGLNPI